MVVQSLASSFQRVRIRFSLIVQPILYIWEMPLYALFYDGTQFFAPDSLY